MLIIEFKVTLELATLANYDNNYYHIYFLVSASSMIYIILVLFEIIRTIVINEFDHVDKLVKMTTNLF